jgi:hypothetical protein
VAALFARWFERPFLSSRSRPSPDPIQAEPPVGVLRTEGTVA